MLEYLILAQSIITGQLHVAVAAFAVPLSIGIIGYKACESVGRNPESAPKVLVQSIIAMAFAEAIIFFAIFLGNFGAPYAG
jgi:F-type H+-transporting ATPase subunit c